jgi:dTDP-4-amino-4,6-dideoxygalactose transaminase
MYFPAEDIEQIKSDVDAILKSGMLTMGEYTRRFEREFAKLCGVKHTIAVNSGTSALEIALRSIGLKNDEVIVPTNTFTATAAAAVFAGGKPVLTDISPETLCLNAENLQKHVTRKTKVVIVVHIGGLACPDIDRIRKICDDKQISLIEDAAHAQGSMINGVHAGKLGSAGCFSFYPTKVMTTGEGGMITTDDEEIAAHALVFRDQGKETFYSSRIVKLGYNWRMTEISAAIGLVQLKRLPEMIAKRNRIAEYYDRELDAMKGIRPLKRFSNVVNNYYKYTAFLKTGINRDEFKRRLAEKGVSCGGEVYWPPLHLQPVYEQLLRTKEGDFPVAEDVCRRMVCLPMFSQMTEDEASYVVEKVDEVLRSF